MGSNVDGCPEGGGNNAFRFLGKEIYKKRPIIGRFFELYFVGSLFAKAFLKLSTFGTGAGSILCSMAR